MRIAYDSPAHATHLARSLKGALGTAGRPCRLFEAQATVATMMGYRDWKELVALCVPGATPSPLDEEVTLAEHLRREASQASVVAARHELAPDDAFRIVLELRPTGCRSGERFRKGDPRDLTWARKRFALAPLSLFDAEGVATAFAGTGSDAGEVYLRGVRLLERNLLGPGNRDAFEFELGRTMVWFGTEDAATVYAAAFDVGPEPDVDRERSAVATCVGSRLAEALPAVTRALHESLGPDFAALRMANHVPALHDRLREMGTRAGASLAGLLAGPGGALAAEAVLRHWLLVETRPDEREALRRARAHGALREAGEHPVVVPTTFEEAAHPWQRRLRRGEDPAATGPLSPYRGGEAFVLCEYARELRKAMARGVPRLAWLPEDVEELHVNCYEDLEALVSRELMTRYGVGTAIVADDGTVRAGPVRPVGVHYVPTDEGMTLATALQMEEDPHHDDVIDDLLDRFAEPGFDDERSLEEGLAAMPADARASLEASAKRIDDLMSKM